MKTATMCNHCFQSYSTHWQSLFLNAVLFLLTIASPQTQITEGWRQKCPCAEAGTCPAFTCASPCCPTGSILREYLSGQDCWCFTSYSDLLLLLLKGFLLQWLLLPLITHFLYLRSYTDCTTGCTAHASPKTFSEILHQDDNSGCHLKYKPCCFDSQERSCHWKLILL